MRRNPTLIVALILIVSMPALDIALVVMILPVASREFVTEPYSLIVSSYLVALLATTLPWGVLSDRIGPRTPLLLGTVLFVAGAIGSSLSGGFWLLITCRVVQGVGAGSMQALTQAVVATQFSAHSSRARVLAALSAAWGGAAVLAPLIVAVFPDEHWRFVFLATVPFGIVSFALLPWTSPADRRPRPQRGSDRSGLLLLIAASACLGIVVTEPEPFVLLAALVGLVLSGALFVRVERRQPDPILPVRLLQQRPFLAALSASILLGSMLVTTNLAAPLYGQVVLGASPAVSGWAYAALSVAWTMSALSSSLLVRQLGVRVVGGMGALTVCLGYALFLLLVLVDARIEWLVVAGFVVGAGLGPLANAVVIVCQEIASAEHVGIASSLNMVTRAAGQAVGVALLAAVVALAGSLQGLPAGTAPTDPEAVRWGVAASLLAAACMAVAAAILIVRSGHGDAGLGRRRSRKAPQGSVSRDHRC